MSTDNPRDSFLGKVVETKAVGNEKLGWFKVFSDLQDHLDQVHGQGHGQRQPGVRQEQRQPKDLISGQNCKNKSWWG